MARDPGDYTTPTDPNNPGAPTPPSAPAPADPVYTPPPVTPTVPTATAPGAPIDWATISAQTGIPIPVLQQWYHGQTTPSFTATHEIYRASDGHIYRVQHDTMGRPTGYQDLGTDENAAATAIGMPPSILHQAILAATVNVADLEKTMAAMKHFGTISYAGKDAQGNDVWNGTDYWGNAAQRTTSDLLGSGSATQSQLDYWKQVWQQQQFEKQKMGHFTDISFGGNPADANSFVAKNYGGNTVYKTRAELIGNSDASDSDLTNLVNQWDAQQKQYRYNQDITQSRNLSGYDRAAGGPPRIIGT